ncbi:MAG: PD-(D/E)XK nuclease family protein, partial [Legionellaceae bacterium]|nr:PD-(D/E)XK nuclease family protein [Legionellaceae bacterium]
HILGFLESSGCLFDKIWVTGLTESYLPQALKPNPLLPMDLQKNYHMPYSNQEKEMDIAARMMQRLSAAGNSVIFSYPQKAQETHIRPSPLLKDFPLYTPLIPHEKAPAVLYALEESYQLPLQRSIGGGTGLLKYQAECPFRAFARFRLQALEASPLSEGIPALDKGQYLHKSLELLWIRLQNQQQLLNLAATDRQTLIQEVVTAALAGDPEKYAVQLLPIEQKRLEGLVEKALRWDSERASFAVYATEKPMQLSLPPLNLTVKIDRIDQLEDGSLCIIDYKTSLPGSASWRSERPQDPQLLLYALSDERIVALWYSALKQQKIQIKGISAVKIHPDIGALRKDEHWEDLQKQWQHHLEQLAQEIHEGKCSPTPHQAALCQRCAYKGLCRKQG